MSTVNAGLPLLVVTILHQTEPVLSALGCADAHLRGCDSPTKQVFVHSKTKG